MIIVRISDKRHQKGFRVKFFEGDVITDEVVEYVKNTPNAFWVQSKNESYYNREDFLKEWQ